MNRPVWRSIWRGFLLRCPNCGQGSLMASYLKVNHSCSVCGTDFSHQKADDAPPYFTILIVGHIVIPLMWVAEREWEWPIWLHMVIWLPMIAILSLWLLPHVKGGVVGLQWAMRMHGFDVEEEKPRQT